MDAAEDSDTGLSPGLQTALLKFLQQHTDKVAAEAAAAAAEAGAAKASTPTVQEKSTQGDVPEGLASGFASQRGVSTNARLSTFTTFVISH